MTKFEMLVMEMRKAQKNYFSMRDSYSLQVAKRLEREVDLRLSGLMISPITPPQTQLDLFSVDRYNQLAQEEYDCK